jgi:hypothetical protein
MDMIAEAAEDLEDTLREFASVNVGYRAAGSSHIDIVPATIGHSAHEALTGDGIVIRFETRDYSISLKDYAAVPKKGDRILETDAAGVRREYEVCVPIGRQACWQWADSFQRRRRIHTQLVESD